MNFDRRLGITREPIQHKKRDLDEHQENDEKKIEFDERFDVHYVFHLQNNNDNEWTQQNTESSNVSTEI